MAKDYNPLTLKLQLGEKDQVEKDYNDGEKYAASPFGWMNQPQHNDSDENGSGVRDRIVYSPKEYKEKVLPYAQKIQRKREEEDEPVGGYKTKKYMRRLISIAEGDRKKRDEVRKKQVDLKVDKLKAFEK